MFISLAILFLLFSESLAQHQCSCGVENHSGRIIGGKVVGQNQYPWMATLVINTPQGQSLCGGSIINDRYILTAAHCVQDATQVSFSVGSNYAPSSPQQLRPASGYVKHESYNPYTNHNDIALIKLSQPLQFSRTVRPVCLPNAATSTAGQLTVAGWGQTEQGRPSGVLLETTVTEYDWNKCNAEWQYGLVQTQFCAAEYGKASCMGDSGGPLMARKAGRATIVGIVSFGLRECGVARNAVYTRVSSYLDWIQRNSRDGVACAN